MDLLSQDEAESILQPYLQRLSVAFSRGERAWQEFTALMPLMARDVSRRGQSNMLYDFIAAEAEREFAPDAPQVRAARHSGFLILIFADKLVLRIKKFKKGSRLYETYGIPTRQRRLWESQQLALPGTRAEVTHAVAGYSLEENLRQSFTGTWVACRNGRFLEWVIEIPDTATRSSGTPMPLPYATSDPRAPVVRSVTPQPSEREQVD